MREYPMGLDAAPKLPPKPAPEKAAEVEPIRQTFEYKDAKGDVIGRAEMEIDPTLETIEEGSHGTITGHQIKKLILFGEKDGKTTFVDILQLTDAGKTRVFVPPTQETHGFYSEEFGVVRAPRPETVFDIGVLLHELGHNGQHQEPRFKRLVPLYRPSSANRHLLSGAWFLQEMLSDTIAAIPEAEPYFDRDALKRLEPLQKKVDSLKKALATLEAAGALASKTQRNEYVAALSETWKEIYRTAKVSNIEALLELPTRIMERDATRRAFAWMRKIKQETGIDLLAAAPLPKNRVETVCERSVGDRWGRPVRKEPEGVTSTVREELMKGLTSYGANRTRLKRPNHPKDIGLSPIAGGTRKPI